MGFAQRVSTLILGLNILVSEIQSTTSSPHEIQNSEERGLNSLWRFQPRNNTKSVPDTGKLITGLKVSEMSHGTKFCFSLSASASISALTVFQRKRGDSKDKVDFYVIISLNQGESYWVLPTKLKQIHSFLPFVNCKPLIEKPG